MKMFLKRLLPESLWSVLRALKHGALRWGRGFAESCGYVVTRRADFYSPLPSEREIHRKAERWNKPSGLRGIARDLDGMKARLKGFRDSWLKEFDELPTYESLCKSGFGPGFTHVDAFTLYATLRELKPGRYLEIGSGLSTCYAGLARERNRRESSDMEMTCVEPYPFDKLREIEGIKLIQSEAQDVPVSVFETLEAGDVLFIDSSHVVRIDGDVPHLFLEALPAVAKGVHIHVHDIPFPYNTPYPADYWTLLKGRGAPHWPMYWNEAMLLQAFLAFNSEFEITFSCPMIRHADEAFLRDTLPMYRPIEEEPNAFSSIWLRRV